MSTLDHLPNELRSALGRLKTRCLTLAFVQGLGFGLLAFLGIATLTGWLDLLVLLPSSVRFCILIVSALMTLGVVTWVLARSFARTSPKELAFALDRAGKTGGQITAGVELAALETSPASNPVSLDLIQRAVQQSSNLAKKQDPAVVQPAAFAFKPIYAASGFALLLCAAWLLWPELISVQAARVLDPRGQHFSAGPYTFDVKPSALAIVYGDPFEVSVKITGARPNETFEWVVMPQGKVETRNPLIGRSDGSLSGSLSTVTAEFDFYIAGPRGRSPAFHINVLNSPVVREVGVRLIYPAYTGLPPFEGPLTQGGPSGVRGTNVTLFIAANRALADGTLTVTPEHENSGAPQTIAMKPPTGGSGQKDNIVTGNFDINEDLRFSAMIHGKDGLPAKEPVTGRCLLVEDLPPRIVIREPVPMSFATPDITLPVLIEAEDDFGISEVKLWRSLNGSRHIATDVPLNQKNARMQQLEAKLPLSEWSLEPGDTVEIYATARDNDPGPPAGPGHPKENAGKIADSPVHRITIISKERYLEMLREQESIDDLQERYKPWLQKLAALRQKWQDAQKAKDPIKLAAVKESLRESLDELKEQLKDPPVFQADFEFAKELKELQETLKKAQEDLEAGNYDDVSKSLGEEQEKLKKNLELPLDLLTKYYHLMEDQALYTTLVQVQQDIAVRARRFTGENEQSLRDLKALFDEQHQVTLALNKLLQDIRDHAGKLPKDDKRFKKLLDSANEFVTRAVDLKIDEALQQAELAFFKRQPKDAQEAAQRAADLMESLLKKGGNNFGEQAQDELGEFSPSMGETADQLLKSQGLPGLGGKSGRSAGGRSQRGGNAGVYGNKPSKKGGGQGNKEKKDGSVPTNSGQKLDDVEGFGVRREFDDGSAGGVPLSAVPARYRSAVRDYNRRVADDLSRKE